MLPITVQVKFQSDFILGSGYSIAGVLDNAVIKTRDGVPYIPGTAIKGNLRQSCLEISRILDLSSYKDNDPAGHIESPLARLFGTPYLPAGCAISSAYLPEDPQYAFFSGHLTQTERHNQIDGLTGTSLEDHFFANEAADKNLEFHFQITRNEIAPHDLNDNDIALLAAGIGFTERLGAKKSRGRGVVELEISSDNKHDIRGIMQSWLDHLLTPDNFVESI